MFVRLWMTENPITIKTDQTLMEAHQCLKEKSIRRLPAVDSSGKLVGIVSIKDVLNALPSAVDGSSAGDRSLFSQSTKIAEIMTPSPIKVSPMTPLEEVATKMRQHKVGAIPVEEDGNLVGIITESDIFAAFMEVLGVKEEGVRVELVTSKDAEDLHDILALLRRYGMAIIALTIHHNYSKSQRLVTLKIKGDELERAIEAIRKSGALINRILYEEDN